MPDTTLALFTSTAQGSTGNPAWSDLDNMLIEGTPTATCVLTAGQTSEIAQLLGPDVTLPDRFRVTNIYIELTGRGPQVYDINAVFIAGGSAKNGSISGPTTLTFDGDLAYWGISEAEAEDFANGVIPLEFTANNLFGTAFMDEGKARITYETIPVPMPALF